MRKVSKTVARVLSRALVLGFIALGLSANSVAQRKPSCPVSPLQEKNMSGEGLRSFLSIASKRVTSIDQFICCLPRVYRTDYSAAPSSIAGQNGRPDSPRLLMSDANQRLDRKQEFRAFFS